jgi:NitT/TauT family transport system ATP-binding protein
VTHAIEEAAALGKKILLLGRASNRTAHIFENPDAGQSGYRSSTAYHELCDQLWKEMHYETA